MVAELTAWIMLKALFFLVLILGPFALSVTAVQERLNKTASGTCAAAIIKLALGIVGVVCLTVALLWLRWHHELRWPDYFQCALIIAFLFGLTQAWQRIRKLSQERRQTKALAEAGSDQQSEFQFGNKEVGYP